jgi:hypothetical protein
MRASTAAIAATTVATPTTNAPTFRDRVQKPDGLSASPAGLGQVPDDSSLVTSATSSELVPST